MKFLNPRFLKTATSSARRDLFFVGCASLVCYLLSLYFDAFENFERFSSRHDNWQIDEILMFVASFGIGLTVYSVRRWKETTKLLRDVEDAQNRLRESNRDLEQFAYVASHDLQEPLRVIAGFADLLGRRYTGKLDNRADEYIHFMLDGCKRMQALISGLLVYSRVGRKSKGNTRCSLDRVLEKARFNLTAQIADEQAAISSGNLPEVQGSEEELVQLFQNLIGNAIKFHGEQRPEVKIFSRASDRNNAHIVVSDNGIGIEEQYQGRIFEMFERVHSRADYEGTGIGLAVCKKIVDRHGGRIWVESNPERGSSFHVILPIQEGRTQ